MSEPNVDLSKFRGAAMVRVVAGSHLTLPLELHVIAQLGYGMDPRSVPVSALQVMGTHPAVYLAERTMTGIMRRPDLYSIRHEDPKIKAEVEAYLWPLLPRLMAGAARGFAYGTVAVVLDWERRTLRIRVPSEKGGKPRNKTLPAHTHYAKAFEVHPDHTTLNLDPAGEFVSADALGHTYNADRTQVWSWDPEFGEPRGQAARRRAWRPYCTALIVELLHNKYLERSVDSPRIAFTPDGPVTVDGTEWEIPQYVAKLLQDLRGSGAIALPSVRDQSGNRKYEVDQLEVADRQDTWDQARNRCDADVYTAYLVPPMLAGGLDDAGGAASKALDGMLREHVEDLATFGAEGLTRLVEIVHRANYDPDKVPPPEVYATDVGKAAARKTLMEVLRLANSAARGEIALRTDMPAALDKLGIPIRDPEDAPEPEGGDGPEPGRPPGRPRDPLGDREERREDSRTEDGEEDTGGDDVEREERE